mmetsp:Transcript_448/g.1004  ORF Transcript_448/g.1004 Transcript_448/m.1004 type:complete len:89 (+) Transcript_448:16-282(+)
MSSPIETRVLCDAPPPRSSATCRSIESQLPREQSIYNDHHHKHNNKKDNDGSPMQQSCCNGVQKKQLSQLTRSTVPLSASRKKVLLLQ